MRPLLLLALVACGGPDAPANRPPVVTLTPPASAVTSDVALRVGVRASDPDGDRLTLGFAWTGPGGERVVTDRPRLAPARTRRGETWRLDVSADDGQDVTVASATLEVADSPPVVVSLRLLPEAPTGDDAITVEADVEDVDGDPLSLTYAWTIDGAVVREGPEAALGLPVRKGQEVGVTLRASDGLAETAATATVTVGNRPPVWDPELLPAPITRAGPVRVDAAGLSDPDGDPVTARITWRVDGADVPAGDALPPEAFARGDTVEATVSAFDGEDWSDPVVLTDTIDDASPVLDVTVTPARAVPGRTVTASVVAADPDGDEVVPVVTWSTGDAGATLVVPDLPPGTPLTVEAAAGGVVATATVPVAAPHWVAVEPDAPRDGDDLRCVADEGATLAWTRDGTPAGSGAEVDHADTRPGEAWRCTATWEDDTAEADVTVGAEAPGGNVLLVILDDVGVDKVGAYGMHPDAPPTPTLDALAAEGALFRNAHAAPSCSPTRAAILTGRQARRTGLGKVIDVDADRFGLSPTTPSIPDVLAGSPYGYATAAVGKWHVGTFADPYPWLGPGSFGFDTWSVILGNPTAAMSHKGALVRGYGWWEHACPDGLDDRDTYLTVAQTDDALDTIATLPEPWFVWLAYSAAHEPFHVPPRELFTQDVDADSPAAGKYDAMVESLDTELGRLLAGVDPAVLADTTVIVLGDNGTPTPVMRDPRLSWGGKGTVFEGGTHVPFLVTGPLVAEPGVEVDGLVSVVDLLPTIAGIAGAPLDPAVSRDGVSFLPMLADPRATVRDVVFTERFEPNGGAPWDRDELSVRDARWRLLRDADGVDHLFDYEATGGLHDGPDLLAAPLAPEAAEAYDRLSARLDAILLDLETP